MVAKIFDDLKLKSSRLPYNCQQTPQVLKRTILMKNMQAYSSASQTLSKISGNPKLGPAIWR